MPEGLWTGPIVLFTAGGPVRLTQVAAEALVVEPYGARNLRLSQVAVEALVGVTPGARNARVSQVVVEVLVTA